MAQPQLRVFEVEYRITGPSASVGVPVTAVTRTSAATVVGYYLAAATVPVAPTVTAKVRYYLATAKVAVAPTITAKVGYWQ